MRAVVALGMCVALALTATACKSISDTDYMREGIGVELSRTRLSEQTSLQNAYLENLCRQTSPSLSDDAGCTDVATSQWPLIVEAGMNDIDLRCDAYLTWLDNLRRSSGPILQQINDTQLAANTIMTATGVAQKQMAIVGAAFGLAYNTFTNINHRLLVEIDKSTVQALVLHRRNDYRAALDFPSIRNRPTAIYALRSYLNLCLPYTIETDINTTVTGVQQAPFTPLKPLVNPAIAGVPIKAQDTISRPIRNPPPPPPAFAQFFDEVNLSNADVERVRRALCAPENEGGGVDQVVAMRALIEIYEDANHSPTVKDKLSKQERQALIADASGQSKAGAQMSCSATKTKNYFEWHTYADAKIDPKRNAAAVEALIGQLNASQFGGQLLKTTTLDGARVKIAAVRSDPALMNNLKLTLSLPPQFSNQMTRELLVALVRLQRSQAVKPSDQGTPPANQGTPPVNQGTPPANQGTPPANQGAPK